jgi:hypothetical protein
MNRNMARSYNRTVAGGCQIIDFKVGQSFGEPQAVVAGARELRGRAHVSARGPG